VLEVQGAFERQLANELAAVLGISPSRIVVKLVAASASAGPAASTRLYASAVDVTMWILGANEQATQATIMVPAARPCARARLMFQSVCASSAGR
jgi:hypothetical protein